MQLTPEQMILMMRNGQNPQQIVLQYLSQQTNNPMAQNLLALAQQGNGPEIEKIARNLMASRGVDYDKEFNAFRKMIGR